MASSEPEMLSELEMSYRQEFLMTRARNLTRLLPLILGFATPAPTQDDQQSGENRVAPETTVLINPRTQSMIMIEGSGDLDAMFRELSSKDGLLPASKSSIEAMSVVKITEEGAECAICLTEYDVGGEAKEMPCKHRYHSGCIGKWLGINGSCPVCRYQMPADEENKKGTEGGDEEGRGRRVGGEVRITFFAGGDDQRDSNSGRASESGDSPSGSRNSDGAAGDGHGLSAQEMDIDH